MIRLNQVEKYYDGKLVLRIPECTLEKGICQVNGINGSGKTTFLKMLAGIIPFNGDVLINDISVKKNALEYRKRVSFAEAEPLYPAFITGQELVAFYQDLRKASPQQVETLIAFSGLQQNLANPIGTYSSGMVKRLSLLLAFIGYVTLILLDEPLATLDAEAAHALPALINEYRLQYGTSFIFSSHQPLFLEASLINTQVVITGQTIHC